MLMTLCVYPYMNACMHARMHDDKFAPAVFDLNYALCYTSANQDDDDYGCAAPKDETYIQKFRCSEEPFTGQCAAGVDGRFWEEGKGRTCHDFCRHSFSGTCRGAYELDNNHCGSGFVRELECDTDILEAEVNHLWHVVCDCPSRGISLHECINACMHDDKFHMKLIHVDDVHLRRTGYSLQRCKYKYIYALPTHTHTHTHTHTRVSVLTRWLSRFRAHVCIQMSTPSTRNALRDAAGTDVVLLWAHANARRGGRA